MKTLKTMIAAMALIFAMNVNAQSEDVKDHLPPDILTILNGPGNSTFPTVPNLPTSKSSRSTNASDVVNYLVDFNNALKNPKSTSATNRAQYNEILSIAFKDPRFQLVQPYIDSATSIPQFLKSLEKIKPQLLAMQEGPAYYSKLSYSLQLIHNQYQSPPFNPGGSLNFSSKGGPNPAEIIHNNEATYGCALEMLTGAAAGGVIGSWLPGIGTAVGAITGATIGLLDCIDEEN